VGAAKQELEMKYQREGLLLLTLVVKAFTHDNLELSFTLDEYAVFHKAELVTKIPQVDAALKRDPTLSPLAKAMLMGEKIDEQSVKALKRAGEGG